MTVKYHKRNTNFQIENFLMRAAHTPDNAYFQLLELKEERELALDNHNVSKIRRDAKMAEVEQMEKTQDPVKVKEAQALRLEAQNWDKYESKLYDALMNEIAFIEKKIEEIKPLCKYVGKMDLISAHEASQEEAWLLELVRRAENYILTTGTIPPDHLMTMRLHPQFKEVILPKIQQVRECLKSPETLDRFISENEVLLINN